MMNDERKNMYAEASRKAGEIARANRRQEWEDLKEEILMVFGNDIKKTWLEDLDKLETHEERIKYILDRKNLMTRVFYPERG